MEGKDRIAMTIGMLVFIVIGLWAILDPTAMEDFAFAGFKHMWLKQLIADFWGRAFGIGVIIFAGLGLFGLYTQSE